MLLAKTQTGYRNNDAGCALAHLSRRRAGEFACVTLADLSSDGADLIVLTGGPDGALDILLGQSRIDAALARLEALEGLFGDRLYIELQRHGLAQERAVEAQLLDLAYRRGLPLVATNEPFFASADGFRGP